MLLAKKTVKKLIRFGNAYASKPVPKTQKLTDWQFLKIFCCYDILFLTKKCLFR